MEIAGSSRHVESNRGWWDRVAPEWVESGRRAWADDHPRWGVYGIPESDVGLLSAFGGGDVVELGCGTAYVSAWLARRGGRPVGIDNSSAQLATAVGFQREFGLDFPLVHGDAERLPFPDRSFDFAISEYGASIWCDPYRWIPDAARVLRPGGRLVFLGNSVLQMLCVFEDDELPAGDRLQRPQFGMHRFEWPDDPGIEFHISPDAAETRFPFVELAWARQWPAEEAWVVRRTG